MYFLKNSMLAKSMLQYLQKVDRAFNWDLRDGVGFLNAQHAAI